MLKVGHRGAKGHAVENSLEAFRKGKKLGADYIELDVRKTKDDELVVMHNANLKICGSKAKVRKLTLKQLKQYRLPNKQKIPTLAEALDVIDKAFIEIKVKGIEEKVIAIIKEKKMLRKVVIISARAGVVKKIKELSKIKTGRLIFKRVTRDSEMIRRALNENADYVCPPFSKVDAEFVKKAHENGLKVFTWTLNKPKKIKLAKEYKVDAIGSDYPDRL